MPTKRTFLDSLAAAHDQSVARQLADDRARDLRYAQDAAATMRETTENAHDRLHPELAAQGGEPAGQPHRAAATQVFLGGTGEDLLAGEGARADIDVPPHGTVAPTRQMRTAKAREPLSGEAFRPFTSAYNRELSSGIIGAERGRTYRDVNTNSQGKIVAWGLRQLQQGALVDAGLMLDDGAWTGMFGVNTDEDFLSNKNHVQDWAFDRYLSDMEGYNRDNLEKVGQVNRRGIAGVPIPITTAGIMAVAHRAGQQWVRAYLDWAAANDWETAGKAMPRVVPFPKNARAGQQHTLDDIRTNFERVETRMRLFKDSPYWRADRRR